MGDINTKRSMNASLHLKNTTKTYKCSVSSILKNAEKKGGVYIILSGAEEVVYVGKSKNVQDRLLQHLNDEDDLTTTMCQESAQFQMVLEESPRERSRLESLLYHYYYEPKHNMKRPDKL